jgi:hypothetical protein
MIEDRPIKRDDGIWLVPAISDGWGQVNIVDGELRCYTCCADWCIHTQLLADYLRHLAATICYYDDRFFLVAR